MPLSKRQTKLVEMGVYCLPETPEEKEQQLAENINRFFREDNFLGAVWECGECGWSGKVKEAICPKCGEKKNFHTLEWWSGN